MPNRDRDTPCSEYDLTTVTSVCILPHDLQLGITLAITVGSGGNYDILGALEYAESSTDFILAVNEYFSCILVTLV